MTGRSRRPARPVTGDRRRVSRGRLVVHAHFYQPSRIDPFSGRIPADPTAAPCARLDGAGQRGVLPARTRRSATFGHISWDLGPDPGRLDARRATRSPTAGFVAGDLGVNGLAQPFHHTILPLASAADRRTEIRWGLRDFELRFGRPAAGIWLPEAAVDLPTLRLLADHGVEHTILAPWQAPASTSRRAGRTGSRSAAGASIVVALYDARPVGRGLVRAGARRPTPTASLASGIAPRFAAPTADDERPLVVIATDGELYGHHQSFRELFLQRLVQPRPDGHEHGFDVVPLAEALRERPGRPFRTVRLVERTSWSCHHGILRWSGACPCAADGGWKAPLRSALERLAAGIDAITERVAAGLPGAPDPWAARDAYVDVRGRRRRAGRVRRRAGWAARSRRRPWRPVLALMEASAGAWPCSPATPGTGTIRSGPRRRAPCAPRPGPRDGSTPSPAHDSNGVSWPTWRSSTSPGHGIDGAEIYRRALAEVGQPPRIEGR